MKNTRFKDDIEAFAKVQEGDLVAYRFLFDTYFSDLCRFIKLFLNDSSIAEQIALDIFVNLWEKKDQVKIQQSLKGYLFKSAKYKAVSYLRQKKNDIILDIDQPEFLDRDGLTPENVMELEKLREIIDEAINDLPPKSRQIYRMAKEENLSHKQIAEILELSPKTVENQVGIAVRKLRVALKPYYHHIFILCILRVL